MSRHQRFVQPSLAELLDRLMIDQIKEVLDTRDRVSYTGALKQIEHDLDLMFGESHVNLDARFIRLVIALAQINLHIWHTKETMQSDPAQFKECTKLGHQLNGIRNQLKNRILEATGLCEQSAKKTNLMTDHLDGWVMSILADRQHAGTGGNRPRGGERQHSFLLTDLLDTLTIDQIKEVLLPEGDRMAYVEEMWQLTHDVELLLKERPMKPTGRLVRLIVFLAQANLYVWRHKDRMQQEPAQYDALLEFAQELNGLRNHVRNLLMEEFGEAEPCHRRATFLDTNGEKWYSTILDGLKAAGETGLPDHLFTLTVKEFARLFGTTVDDLPPVCRHLIDSKNFQFRKLDMLERDRIVTSILKRIDSSDLWVSGPDKQHVWEHGWFENLQAYEQGHDLSALTPKFIHADRVLRLDRDYVQPLDPHFEFNFVEVYRQWAFRKYLKDVQAIYEFGCGSCQHLVVLANVFPEKALHGLDWAAASSRIIEKLVEEKGWNIAGHVFDLYAPDEHLVLQANCGIFTVGTMEQLGRNFEPFLQFLLRKRPAIVVHIETMSELYDETHLADYLALRYDRKRNYLEGYLDRLRTLEQEGRIEIVKAHRLFFGSLYHDSYSLVVWRPN